MTSESHRFDLQQRSNKIFKTIKDFETLFPDEFRKCGITKCGHCNGSGITDKHQLGNCIHCGRMGYKGFEKIGDDFICRSCNGYACERCDYTGIVDWVTHATGSDTIGERKYI